MKLDPEEPTFLGFPMRVYLLFLDLGFREQGACCNGFGIFWFCGEGGTWFPVTEPVCMCSASLLRGSVFGHVGFAVIRVGNIP